MALVRLSSRTLDTLAEIICGSDGLECSSTTPVALKSEDEFIENILVPMYSQLGFAHVSPTGHKDKQLEYGKDLWLKYQLPTAHYLYFGIQAKKGKLDSAGKSENENVGEVLNQVRMMLDSPIFDPEINKKVLLDHVFIASASEITKAAKTGLRSTSIRTAADTYSSSTRKMS